MYIIYAYLYPLFTMVIEYIHYIFRIFVLSFYYIESTCYRVGHRFGYLPESPCLSGLTLHNNGKLMLLLYINGKWYSYRHVARPASWAFEARGVRFRYAPGSGLGQGKLGEVQQDEDFLHQVDENACEEGSGEVL